MKTILFVSGEPSGADYVNDILKELRHRCPQAKLAAVGDNRNPVEGVEYLFHYGVFTHFGFVSVWLNMLPILSAVRQIRRWCKLKQPDLVVLVDSPGLNLRLAAKIRQDCDKIFYFISPHIWAWNYGRVQAIRKWVDTMYPVLPFEVEIYRKEKIPVVLVQHPKQANIARHRYRVSASMREFIDNAGDVVGLLPGSRPAEISRFIPLLTETALSLLDKNCRMRFIMPVRRGSLRKAHLARLKKNLGRTLMIVEDDFYNAIKSCDFCLCASGTASLELALLGVPMIVYYKMSLLDSLVYLLRTRNEYVSLVNILFNKRIVPECLGPQANSDTLSAEMEMLARRRGHYLGQLDRFERLHSMLNDDRTMAEEIRQFIEGSDNGLQTPAEGISDNDSTQQRR